MCVLVKMYIVGIIIFTRDRIVNHSKYKQEKIDKILKAAQLAPTHDVYRPIEDFVEEL